MKKPLIPRIWIKRIASVILAPTLFLLLVEGVLRLSSYGYPTSFFLPIDGGDVVTGNSRYTYQYFPKQLVREPDLIRMGKDKSGDVFRIFVMGGSAARGTPDPRFGLGRILEVMLQEAYPDRQFEVINTGMVAINSHVVMRIAKECADYDPDLFVVYMGNNEAVGPFGVGTKYNEQTPGRGMVAMSITAKNSRTGQLIRNLMEGADGGSTQQAEWLGMETFNKHQVAVDDPRLEKVYSHFKANLEEMIETAEDANIPMILCTVPVNLKNCAPLASGHGDDLNEVQLEEWKRLYTQGVKLEAEGSWAEADEQYMLAEKIDDQYAELHFRRARCALALKDFKTAAASFETARDYDMLRFRTDSKINQMIRDVSKDETKSDTLVLLDAEKRFKSLPQNSHGIVGDEFFYEHVHFNFEGNYELARMVFKKTVKKLDDEAASSRSAPSLARCAELLALSNRDRYQMAFSMINLVVKPPFLDQLDYYERCEKLHSQIRSLRKYNGEEGLNEAEEMLKTVIKSRPDDIHNSLALAKLLLAQQKGKEAESIIRELLKSLPDRADFYSLLGQALLIDERKSEAVESFDRSIELAAQPLDYMILIAEHFENAGEKERAMELFQRALAKQPDSANRMSRLAEIYLKRGEREEALKLLERADSLLPENGRILFNLSRVHFEKGDIKTAVEKLRATIEANPFHLGARKQLGLILKKQGRPEEAVEQLSKVIPQEPDQFDLRLHRAEIWISLREFDKAESDYRSVLKVKPDELNAAFGLAWVLAVGPMVTPEKRAEAVTLAEKVVEATRRRAAKPLDVLAAAYAAAGQFDEAVACADEAWGLALGGKDETFSKAVYARLKLYKENKAYHLPEKENQ